MKNRICVLTGVMLFSMIFDCYSQKKTGDFTITYAEPGSGTIRTYYMYVPTDYDSTKSYPFLYAWHGSGMTGSNMRSNMKILNTTIKGIICCPDINGITTTTQLNTMIDNSLYYVNLYNIDKTKRVVTGFSMGGNYCFQIGLLNPNDWNGIIGFSPAIGSGQFNTTMWDNITKVRMAAILGTLDFNWTAVNALMLEIKSKGGNLLYLVKQNVTHSDNVYYASQQFLDDYQSCYDFVIGLTSIDDNRSTEKLNLLVFPNPFSSKFEIEIKQAVSEKLTIRVFDVLGKKLYEENSHPATSNGQITLNFENLDPGIYLLVVSDGVRTNSQKIIKHSY